MKPDLSDILNEHIEAMLNSEKVAGERLPSLEEKHAKLEPMLATAEKLIDASKVTPDVGRKQQIRERLIAEVEQKRWEDGIDRIPAKEKVTAKASQWRRNFVRLGILTIAFAMLSGGTLVIAEESLPGSPFYPLKLTAEKARIGLASSDDSRAKLHLAAAEKRIDELRQLRNGDANSDGLIRAIAKNLEAAELAAGHKDTTLSSALADFTSKNEAVLKEVLEKAPESAKPAIEHALNTSKGLSERKRTGKEDVKNSDHYRRSERKTGSRGGKRTPLGTEQPETRTLKGNTSDSDPSAGEGKKGGLNYRKPATAPSRSGRR